PVILSVAKDLACCQARFFASLRMTLIWQSKVLKSLLVATSICMSAASALAEDSPGAKIFRDQCARCHGAAGEGTDDYYPDPLAGDKSIAQLNKYIHETMPDDSEKKCTSEDSAKVAAYIYEAFYSPEARTRNKPSRVELSRL